MSEIKSIKCPNCGSPLDIDTATNTAVCNFCGGEFELNDNDEIRKAVINAKVEAEKMQMKSKLYADMDEKKQLRDFKRSKLHFLLIICILFNIFLCIGLALSYHFFMALIALVQLGLNVIALLIGYKAIKTKKKNFSLVLFIIGICLIVPMMLLGPIDEKISYAIHRYKNEKWEEEYREDLEDRMEDISWDIVSMSEIIPSPGENLRAIVRENTEEKLDISIYDFTRNDLKNFKTSCEQRGFVIDKSKTLTDSITYFNKEGYKLNVYYYDDELSLRAEDAIGKDPIAWKSLSLASKLPELQSPNGEIISDRDDSLRVYVHGMDRNAFKEYAKKCEQKGFKKRSMSEDYFSADKGKDYDLTVSYYGNNIIEIQLYYWG